MTPDADRHLLAMEVYEQRIIETGMLARLVHEPMKESKAIKELRPNPVAEYELRLGEYRVLYNVEEEVGEVVIGVIGRKVGNRLIVEGKEFHGHESDKSEGTDD
jgi:hypothetical protein